MRFELLASGLVLVMSLAATMNLARADQRESAAELAALSDAWIDAEVRRDTDALEHLLDERFIATFASGKTIDRTEYVDWIRKSDIKPFQVTNEVVHVHGDTALVVGVDVARTVKFTWVAIKEAQRWRVIGETFSRVPASK